MRGVEKMQNDLICPSCNSPLYWSLDGYGRTPWHLHCDKCSINIGVNKQEKAIELIQKYNKPNTYIEYHNNDIQVLYENNERIIFKETE